VAVTVAAFPSPSGLQDAATALRNASTRSWGSANIAAFALSFCSNTKASLLTLTPAAAVALPLKIGVLAVKTAAGAAPGNVAATTSTFNSDDDEDDAPPAPLRPPPLQP
jgi:hypothetical protein